MKIALSRILPLLLSATAATASASSFNPNYLLSRTSGVSFVNFHSTFSSSTNRSSSGKNHSKTFVSLRMTSSSSSWSSQQKQALLSCPTIPLRDGTPHPAIGFGTYKVGFVPASASSAVVAGTGGGGGGGASTENEMQRTAEECIRDALDLGYRFFEWYVALIVHGGSLYLIVPLPLRLSTIVLSFSFTGRLLLAI